MNLNAHLDFNGNCEEAFRVYEDCLGGSVTTLVRYGTSPLAATFPDLADKVLHATLVLGDDRLTGVDLAPTHYRAPQGFSIQLNLTSPADAQRIYHTLSPGGQIKMPLQKTFWAELFAVFHDRFGIPWEINCSGKASS